MKKLLFAALCMLLVVGMVGCGGGGKTKTEKSGSIDDIKIVQDVYNLVDDDAFRGRSISNNHFVAIFEYEGTTYRIWAEVSDEIQQKIFDIDFFDPDRDKKEKELLKDLPVGELTDLTAGMPTEAEVAKYVGKTGKELVDLGFGIDGFSAWDGTVFFLYLGDYAYEATMNEKLDDYDEDASYEEIIAPFTVKSIVCTGVGSGALDIFSNE